MPDDVTDPTIEAPQEKATGDGTAMEIAQDAEVSAAQAEETAEAAAVVSVATAVTLEDVIARLDALEARIDDGRSSASAGDGGPAPEPERPGSEEKGTPAPDSRPIFRHWYWRGK